jgi:hypothetical protein
MALGLASFAHTRDGRYAPRHKSRWRDQRVVSDYLRDLPGNAVDGLIGQVLRARATTGGEDEDELTVNLFVFSNSSGYVQRGEGRG